MIVRPYQSSDRDEIVQLWMKCGLVVPQNHPLQDIERKEAVDPQWFLVGLVDDQIVATCMAGYEGHRGCINYLAVDPSLRRRGLAREIMGRAEELLREAGCPKINLMVRTSNRDAIGFYRQIGYNEDPVVCLSKRIAEADAAFEDGELAAGDS